ncbi:hypothetical protein Mapa_000206 [Marchantia paleacea]|nr:hypothetical protein Mapa_000206 [Marchantia paleacea]
MFLKELKSLFLFCSNRKLLALKCRKAVTLHGFDRSSKVVFRKFTRFQETEVHVEFRVVLHFVCKGPRLRLWRSFRALNTNGLRRCSVRWSHLGNARAALWI